MHSIVVFESGAQRARARNRLRNSVVLAAALLAAGCGVDAGADASDVDVATTEQGLRASNVSLPWTGAAASGVLSTSNVGALQVIYSVSVGTTSGAISGLQVCWYAPSNADNLYRQGDQFACSIVGRTTATAWGQLTCPVNKVLSGTRVRLNAAGTKVLEFTPFCRSLTNPSEQPTELNTVIATGGEVASFFWIQDDCGDFSAVNSPAYIEHFVASANFRGFQAACVRP
jgi:hypothetical protein